MAVRSSETLWATLICAGLAFLSAAVIYLA
jgi:hypothetical protein